MGLNVQTIFWWNFYTLRLTIAYVNVFAIQICCNAFIFLLQQSLSAHILTKKKIKNESTTHCKRSFEIDRFRVNIRRNSKKKMIGMVYLLHDLII